MKAFASYFEHEGEQYVVLSRSLGRPVAFESLTAAELAVAEGLLDGSSIRALARERGVSERTIANQTARVYRKLGVGSRHELVALVAQSLHRSVA
jgi:DNA-binding NarL/FixJ family response regulator